MPDNNYSSVGYPRPVGEENKLPQSAENEVVAALVAQQADGQTDLVTPAARVAAEALAARTTGALARKKSDGTYEDGPMDFTVANDFDPTDSATMTAFLAALSLASIPIRSTMITLDGQQAWVKSGVANTDWNPVDELRYFAVAPSPGPSIALDCDVVLPVGCKAEIEISLTNPGAITTDWFLLRINGATIVGEHCSLTTSGGNAYTNVSLYAVRGQANSVNAAELTIKRQVNGKRSVSGKMWASGVDGANGWSFGTLTAGEITKIGIMSAGGNILAAGSRIDVLVKRARGV